MKLVLEFVEFLAGLVIGGVLSAGLVAHIARQRVSEYKDKWHEALRLMAEDPDVPPGVEIVAYQQKTFYTLSGREFMGLAFKVIKDGTEWIVGPGPDINQVALDPSLPNFDVAMKDYRAKVEAFAKTIAKI